MQSIRSSVLRHARLRASTQPWSMLEHMHWLMCMSSSSGAANPDQVIDRVVALVKKFDKINANKVTETADFQKDLSLDSLDKVELVMAFEEEFSIEIPDDKADKFTCCADVAKYIASGTEQTTV